MRAFRSYAKFNLGLAVLGRRSDGYHELDTVMQTVSLCDRLEFELLGEPRLEVAADTEAVPSGPENLVWRALALLQTECGVRRGMRCMLRKRIPARAGLGGGSSNAACALVAANRIWKLRLNRDDLEELAARIGSDVPFFIRGGTQRCRGRGERVSPLDPLPDSRWVIVKPSFDLATGEVYARVTAELTDKTSKVRMLQIGLAKRDFPMIVDGLFNDLESAAILVQPECARVRAWMGQQGLKGVILAGSGSAWVGWSPDPQTVAQAKRGGKERGWQVFVVRASRRGWSEAKTLAH